MLSVSRKLKRPSNTGSTFLHDGRIGAEGGSCHSPLHFPTLRPLEALPIITLGLLLFLFFLFSVSGQLCSFTMPGWPCSPMCTGAREGHTLETNRLLFISWLHPLTVGNRQVMNSLWARVSACENGTDPPYTTQHMCLSEIIWKVPSPVAVYSGMLNKCSFSSLLLLTGDGFATFAPIPTMLVHHLTNGLPLAHQTHVPMCN